MKPIQLKPLLIWTLVCLSLCSVTVHRLQAQYTALLTPYLTVPRNELKMHMNIIAERFTDVDYELLEESHDTLVYGISVWNREKETYQLLETWTFLLKSHIVRSVEVRPSVPRSQPQLAAQYLQRELNNDEWMLLTTEDTDDGQQRIYTHRGLRTQGVRAALVLRELSDRTDIFLRFYRL